ncbi:transcriptional regulator [Streptomyces longispororuber]|uniref:Transcriptional regulator n=1 Tax=Streptomyces longispororuber TaxID=68230 RepID=A0A919A972_9ACTN|nr:ANTAR domain-containing protein [Streptomyces longispororuber]GHE93489.1 transcriptional regulator [Streptomyces longispororuber]
MSREQHIARTFVELADTLVEDFDLIDFLQQMTVRCQELLDITDAAVFLNHPPPRLHSPAPCDPGPALRDVLEAARSEGPALDAHRAGKPVTTGEDPAETAARWPQFAQMLRAAGYTRATAVPMRLRKDCLGSLLLLHTGETPLGADDLALAQALADAATIGLLQAGTIHEQHTVNKQLHTALQSRIIVEQAKGVLAARRHIRLNDAFEAMRHHARHHRTLLIKVARDVIENDFVPAVPPASPARPADSS